MRIGEFLSSVFHMGNTAPAQPKKTKATSLTMEKYFATPSSEKVDLFDHLKDIKVSRNDTKETKAQFEKLKKDVHKVAEKAFKITGKDQLVSEGFHWLAEIDKTEKFFHLRDLADHYAKIKNFGECLNTLKKIRVHLPSNYGLQIATIDLSKPESTEQLQTICKELMKINETIPLSPGLEEAYLTLTSIFSKTDVLKQLSPDLPPDIRKQIDTLYLAEDKEMTKEKQKEFDTKVQELIKTIHRDHSIKFSNKPEKLFLLNTCLENHRTIDEIKSDLLANASLEMETRLKEFEKEEKAISKAVTGLISSINSAVNPRGLRGVMTTTLTLNESQQSILQSCNDAKNVQEKLKYLQILKPSLLEDMKMKLASIETDLKKAETDFSGIFADILKNPNKHQEPLITEYQNAILLQEQINELLTGSIDNEKIGSFFYNKSEPSKLDRFLRALSYSTKDMSKCETILTNISSFFNKASIKSGKEGTIRAEVTKAGYKAPLEQSDLKILDRFYQLNDDLNTIAKQINIDNKELLNVMSIAHSAEAAEIQLNDFFQKLHPYEAGTILTTHEDKMSEGKAWWKEKVTIINIWRALREGAKKTFFAVQSFFTREPQTHTSIVYIEKAQIKELEIKTHVEKGIVSLYNASICEGLRLDSRILTSEGTKELRKKLKTDEAINTYIKKLFADTLLEYVQNDDNYKELYNSDIKGMKVFLENQIRHARKIFALFLKAIGFIGEKAINLYFKEPHLPEEKPVVCSQFVAMTLKKVQQDLQKKLENEYEKDKPTHTKFITQIIPEDINPESITPGELPEILKKTCYEEDPIPLAIRAVIKQPAPPTAKKTPKSR